MFRNVEEFFYNNSEVITLCVVSQQPIRLVVLCHFTMQCVSSGWFLWGIFDSSSFRWHSVNLLCLFAVWVISFVIIGEMIVKHFQITFLCVMLFPVKWS